MSKTIGIIGLGSIGMRHANNLEAMGHTVLGYDPAPELKQSHAHDLAFVIRKSDAIVIASPTAFHESHIELALAAGKPIFVEKPIADRSKAWMQSVAMVGTNLRFHSCVKKIKEWAKWLLQFRTTRRLSGGW